MPYHKVGPDRYASPNGNEINGRQLRFWHAHGDKWPGEKSEGYSRGGDIKPSDKSTRDYGKTDRG